MELKFESISNRIHWSLALKAALVGVAWYAFSFPFFALLVVALYLVPLFDPLKFIAPFLAMLVLGAVLPPYFLFSLFFACAFYFILGIKDLILVQRSTAYEALILLFLLGFSFSFFFHFQAGASGVALVFVALGVASIALLVQRFFTYHEKEGQRSAHFGQGEKRIASFLYAFFLGECALAVLLIPMNSTLRTALLFLAGMVGFEVLTEHVLHELTWQRAFAYLTLLFVFTILMLTANQWGL